MNEATKVGVLGRIAGLWLAAMTLGALAVTYGFFPDNVGWVPAWCGLATLHGLAAWGVWTGRGWARAFTLGIGLFGLGAFVHALYMLGAWPAILVGCGAYTGALLLSAFTSDGLERRQRWSLGVASLALVPAAGFALAPEQGGFVMVATIAGAALVWSGAWGVARGRTWGLLLGLVGAPLMGVCVAFAPDTAYFETGHFMVGQPLQPLMLDVLGIVATTCAVLAVVPYLGGMLRFLRSE